MSSRPFPMGSVVAVRGVSNYQDEVVLMREGQAVRVVHEPDNEYDQNACVVLTSAGGKLGYVAAAIAPRLVARGEGAWRGKVSEVRKGETWGMSIRIESPLNAPAAEAEPEREHDEEPVPTVERKVVRARSGRVLGTLVRREGQKVVVRNATGVEVSYPEELVKLNG